MEYSYFLFHFNSSQNQKESGYSTRHEEIQKQQIQYSQEEGQKKSIDQPQTSHQEFNVKTNQNCITIHLFIYLLFIIDY